MQHKLIKSQEARGEYNMVECLICMDFGILTTIGIQ